jgi:C-terminal processing protease CtpA/Prc
MIRSSIVGLALIASPLIARAQAFIVPPSPDIDKYGCTGFAYNVTLAHLTRTAETMTVTRVDSLSPAAVAGLQPGDSIVMINGVALGDAPIGSHWRKAIGTKNASEVRRAGATRAITLVTGQLGPEPTRADEHRVCRPVPGK